MSEWQIQMMIPDFPHTHLAGELPGTVLEEIEGQQQVRKEIYHHLKRKHQGFFVSHEAAELVSGVTTALLGMARVLERSGVSMPRELQVLLNRKGGNEENYSRVQPRSVSA